MSKPTGLRKFIPKRNKVSSNRYTISLSPPDHLLIIHDGDDSGVMSVVSALRRHIQRGLCVVHPSDMAKLIMDGLANSNKHGINFEGIYHVDKDNYRQIFARIDESNAVGVLSTTSLPVVFSMD